MIITLSTDWTVIQPPCEIKPVGLGNVLASYTETRDEIFRIIPDDVVSIIVTEPLWIRKENDADDISVTIDEIGAYDYIDGGSNTYTETPVTNYLKSTSVKYSQAIIVNTYDELLLIKPPVVVMCLVFDASGDPNVTAGSAFYIYNTKTLLWVKLFDSSILFNNASYEPSVPLGNAAQYYRGDKSWRTLDKTVVGLNNVDNTSDSDKPLSTAATSAISSINTLLSNKVTKVDGYNLISDVEKQQILTNINNISTILTSSDTALDDLQEIVDYIKINRETLSALDIDSVAGLRTALNGKASITHNHDTSYEPKNANIQQHISGTSNPHGVTKEQVGLGNVPNLDTSDAVQNTHTHTNKTILDATEESFTTILRNNFNSAVAWITTNGSNLITHLSSTNNPHTVTKDQVGLNNVPNLNTTNAVNNEHTHANKTVLDAIQEALTTTLKTAYNAASTWVTTNGANILNHLSNVSNPHSVTKTQVGLGNADNTSDANKPISNATATALNGKVDIVVGKGLSTEDYTTEEKSKLSGIAINANNFILQEASPTVLGGVKIDNDTIVINNGVISAANSGSGDMTKAVYDTNDNGNVDTADTAIKLATARTISITGDITWSTTFDGSGNATGSGILANSGVVAGTYTKVTVDTKGRVTTGYSTTTLNGYGITDAISSSEKGANNGVATLGASGVIPSAQLPTMTNTVNGRSGDVTLAKSDVGLSNVDNTSDANKPVSDATATALGNKVDKVAGKELSSNDYTTTEKDKLAGLSNYVKPASEPISYIDGLTLALAAKLETSDISGLQTDISNIMSLLTSDDLSLDTLQEIVDFITLNKATLDNLAISNIAGLQTALDLKAAASHNHVNTYEPKNANIQSHISSVANPHGVTKAQVGLENVPNLDTTAAINNAHTHSNKSVLDSIQEALTTVLKNGYDSAVTWVSTNGTNILNHVSSSSNPHGVTKSQVGLGNVPNLDTTDAVNNQHTHTNKTILDAITASFTTTLKTSYDTAASWIATNGANLINHISAINNPHSVTKSQVGLGSVDNTSDIDKPVSTATSGALGAKVDKSFIRTDDTVGTIFINSTSEHTKGLVAFTGMIGIRINNLYSAVNMNGRMEVIISEPFVDDRTFIVSGHWNHTDNVWDSASCIELTKSTTPVTVSFAKNATTSEVWILFGGLDTVRANTRVSIINVVSSYVPALNLNFDILPVTSLTDIDVVYTITDTRLKDISDLVALFNPSEYDKKTSKKNGFVSDSDAHSIVDLGWDETTKLLTITRKAGVTSYGIYCDDVLYTKTEDISYRVEPLATELTPGLHYVYFENGILKDIMSFSTDLLLKHTLVAMIYATTQMQKWDDFAFSYTEYKSIAQFEAHGSAMSGWEHLLDHLAIGAEYESGLDLVLTLGNGSLEAHCEIGITSGYTQDEDLRHTYPVRTITDQLLRYIRNGNYWDIDESDPMGSLRGATYSYWGEYPRYYTYNASTETYDIGNLVTGEIQLIHIFAIPRIPTPQVACIIGEGKYANIALASAAAIIRPNLNPLPAPEYKLLYTIPIEAGAFGNIYNAKIIPFSDGNTHVDWREITKGIPSSNAPTLSNASDVSVALTPSAYTPTTSTVEGHLTGLDNKIGELTAGSERTLAYYKAAIPISGAATFTVIGVATSVIGTITAKTLTNTNTYTKLSNTTEVLQATASNTTVAYYSNTAAAADYLIAGIEHHFTIVGGVATGAANTTARFLMGFTQNSIASNLEPSTMTNCVTLGYDSADTNLQIMHNDSSGVCAKINTGWNRPTVDRTNIYSFHIWTTGLSGLWNYEIVNLVTLEKLTGTINTDVPSLTGTIIPTLYMGPGTTSAVKGICVGKVERKGYII